MKTGAFLLYYSFLLISCLNHTSLFSQGSDATFELISAKSKNHIQIGESPIYLIPFWVNSDTVAQFIETDFHHDQVDFTFNLEIIRGDFDQIKADISQNYTHKKDTSLESQMLQDPRLKGVFFHIIHTKNSADKSTRFITFHILISDKDVSYSAKVSYPIHKHSDLGMSCNRMFRNIFVDL